MMAKQFTFSQTPFIKRSRSRFDLSYNVKGSIEVGRLVPFYEQEVYPGDGIRCNSKMVIRLAGEFLKVPFDTIFADVYYFFVPWRTVFDGFEGVFGNPSPNSWIENELNEIPVVHPNNGECIARHSLGDYFGLPLCKKGSPPPYVSVLPFRAYAKIYDEWFRDENLIDPINIVQGSVGASEWLNANPFSADNYTGMCAQVSKVHDYFSSCLPSPQKGEPVSVFSGISTFSPLIARPNLEPQVPNLTPFGNAAYFESSRGIPSGGKLNLVLGNESGETAGYGFLMDGDNINAVGNNRIMGSNLGINLNQFGLINVNDLRYAFQTQKFLERDARGGSRYQEYLAAHWGIVASDSRLQRPEYLGGRRIPLSVQQVVQTSSTSNEPSQLGSLGSFSLSVDSSHFNKSFTEHGIVIGVMALRYYHTYSQGVPRWFRRTSRYDFYDPVFANIGEQPVYTEEIFYSSASSRNPNGSASVFGYNEAWADLRYRPNRLAGDMRIKDPGIEPSDTDEVLPGALWTFADDYANSPVLSEEWITENPSFFKRTTTLGDEATVDSFIYDIYHSVVAYRELPTYSVPSLIDHN
ncbi:major capsid protein [Sigmofec virus UA08Rod_6641]|uniref:Major capsid protein n=1 Tax=Sigmofec virus UA08Rod_6641 TaxID=2929236 RepID=A0A976N146_9VIRU|nr:major capsid protein [Sigmofec virus UA08Rod_6641]